MCCYRLTACAPARSFSTKYRMAALVLHGLYCADATSIWRVVSSATFRLSLTSSQVVLDWSSVLMSSMLSSREPVAVDSRCRTVSSSCSCVFLPAATYTRTQHQQPAEACIQGGTHRLAEVECPARNPWKRWMQGGWKPSGERSSKNQGISTACTCHSPSQPGHSSAWQDLAVHASRLCPATVPPEHSSSQQSSQSWPWWRSRGCSWGWAAWLSGTAGTLC